MSLGADIFFFPRGRLAFDFDFARLPGEGGGKGGAVFCATFFGLGECYITKC